jgi:lysine 2,3-aminomutase
MTAPDRTLRTAADLVAEGLVSPAAADDLAAVAARYAVAITPSMADLAREDPTGPIGRQFVPDARELVTTPEERADPIDDAAYSPVRGVVHRYPDRALLKVTGLCPVYCRFCFRREMVGPGKEQELDAADLDRAFAYLASRPEIFEVILTGGDPLILSPRRLAGLAARLSALPHVQVVRWHSRVPVVAPDRVTPDLIAALRAVRQASYIAVHANHPHELTAPARAALAQLADAGIVLLGQTVLLRGVNDDPETLAALMRGFVAARVKPYYLHHPDLAPGTSHFRLPIARGQAIVRALRGRISGLAQPTYVLDVPDGRGKVPIGPTFADVGKDGTTVWDLAGSPHTSEDWNEGGGRP